MIDAAFTSIQAESLEPAALREALRRVPALRGALVDRLIGRELQQQAPDLEAAAALGAALDALGAEELQRLLERILERLQLRLDEARVDHPQEDRRPRGRARQRIPWR